MTSVSFILPVYNKVPYLPGVIAAITAQQGDFSRELIFVDDDSTDGSAELIEQLIAGMDNARLVRQRNQGPGGATNRAAAEARGEYLKLVDADDLLLPRATDWLLTAMTRHKASMSYGFGAFYEAGEPVAWPSSDTMPPVRAIADPVGLLIRNSFLCPSFMLVRRDLYLEVGGCDEHTFAQDYSLGLRLALRGPFACIDGTVALNPRVAPGRLSAQEARVLHDVSHQVYLLVRDHALSSAHKRQAAKRITARALRYLRRHPQAQRSLAQSWLRYLAARSGLPFDAARLIHDSLRDFGLPSQIDGHSPFPGSKPMA